MAEEFGYKTEYVSAEVAQAVEEEADAEEDLQPRAHDGYTGNVYFDCYRLTGEKLHSNAPCNDRLCR